jgi:glycosyltransferase involved in cell wall biosynthesis
MKDKDFLLSIVVPVFNEEKLIRESVKRLVTVASQIGCRYELIFINDGSRDATFEILKNERAQNPNIRIIHFTRNFGHQMAITAGMDHIKGDVMVTIDGDLQDPPELIPEMLVKWREGYDVVYARRKRRLGETIFKRMTATLFYRLVRKVSNVDIPVDVGDYRLMSRRAVHDLNQMRERHRYVRGLVAWLGYKQTFVEYVRDKRYAGETKYSLMKMIRFSMDGLSSFSIAPLRLATFLGFFCAAFSFLYICYALFAYLSHQVVSGWTTVVIAVFFLGGVQLICLGILGEYIGMIHSESKKRPLYLIEEILG